MPAWGDTMEFGLDGSDLVDDDTAVQATIALRAAYGAAVRLVAPRIHARLTTLIAAGDNGQLITDTEWAEIAATHVDDVIGDSILDGIVAGAAQFGKLAADGQFVKAFLSAANSFASFVSQLRGSLNQWIDNKIGEGITGDWGIGDVVDELTKQSPLSPDKADIVVDSELQAANNAGLHASLDPTVVDAVRWVTRRDERVRPTHVAADKDTIPAGSQFSVGGYLCDYPGDPALPFALRVHCRCQLAYVVGTEVKRVVGSTKAELRVKARGLSIKGRSTMNKGQLQSAVLKSMCLQGLAGGPDCPDLFDKMNRNTLLAHARGESIKGRYRMNRPQLIFHLRRTIRGNDALLARGYVTTGDLTAAQAKARRKRGSQTAEFTIATISPTPARRAPRAALFAEFDGHVNGYVPCVHCGLRLGLDPKQGLAILVPDPIIPWSLGGTTELSNLVPACPACFHAKGGRSGGMWDDIMAYMSLPVDATRAELSLRRVEFRGWAGEDVARDADGKWTAGPAGADTAPDAKRFGKKVPAKRGTAPAEWFASPSQAAASRRHADRKIRDVPQPTAEKIAKNLAILERAKTKGRAGGEMRGNSFTRRKRGEALFAEFGGKEHGYVPCAHCGLKVAPKARDGHALMQQDKILVASEGGDYGTPTNFPNLVPSCTGCNASRNDAPLSTRPKWDTTKIKRRKRAAATIIDDWTGITLIGEFATDPAGSLTATVSGWCRAFPLGWDDPDVDTLDSPVEGYLGHRTVEVDWGTYDQWLVGGEVVDKDTIERLGDTIVASGSEDVPRDDHGRWTDHGGSTAVKDRPRWEHNGDVEDTFTLSGDLYDAVPFEVNRTTRGFEVKSTITNKQGKEVGDSHRQIRPGPDGTLEVYHESMSIRPQFQGQGIAAEYLRDSVEMYRAAGVDRVAVSAVSNGTTTNGGYTWAKLGFELNDAKNGHENMAQSMRSTPLPEPADMQYYPPGDHAQTWAALADRVDAKEAGIQDVLAHPLGKDFLLGKFGPTAWNGVMVLNDKGLTAAADQQSIDFEAWAEAEQELTGREEDELNAILAR